LLESSGNVVVLTGQNIALFKGDPLGSPGTFNRVIVLFAGQLSASISSDKTAFTDFVIGDWNRVMNDIADSPDLGLQQLLLLGSRGEEVLLLLLEVGWEMSAPIPTPVQLIFSDLSALGDR
jgi:hypothetical protein